ncbi:MAG: hypothetical protein ACKVU4_11205 [Phycisphaerales bacterium]
MGTTCWTRLFAALLLAWALAFAPGCDAAVAEDIELTLTDMRSAADRQDGEAFVNLLAPESFDYYERVRKLALDASYARIDALTITEKLDILVMRNRCTRKQLEPLDGRGWVVYAIGEGWYDGPRFDEESVHERNVTVRGTTATLEVVYKARQAHFTGEGSGQRVSDTFTFLQVEDRWLADWRGQSALFERLVNLTRDETHKSVNQILEGVESKVSLKPVDKSIWETPMR